MKQGWALYCGLCCLSVACGDSAAPAIDADLRPDATVILIDAGPKTYETFEDFPRDGCDDDNSLAVFNFLGKWENTPDDGSAVFDSYFLMEDAELKGLLGVIPATVHVDEDNLYLHRRLNLTSLAVNLCAVVDGDTLTGYIANCNGLDCTVGTLSATLVEPVTE